MVANTKIALTALMHLKVHNVAELTEALVVLHIGQHVGEIGRIEVHEVGSNHFLVEYQAKVGEAQIENPHRPTREFWNRVYPGVERGLRKAHPEWTKKTLRQRARETVGSIWYHKMSPTVKARYERMRKARERGAQNPPYLVEFRAAGSKEIIPQTVNAVSKHDAKQLAIILGAERGWRIRKIERLKGPAPTPIAFPLPDWEEAHTPGYIGENKPKRRYNPGLLEWKQHPEIGMWEASFNGKLPEPHAYWVASIRGPSEGVAEKNATYQLTIETATAGEPALGLDKSYSTLEQAQDAAESWLVHDEPLTGDYLVGQVETKRSDVERSLEERAVDENPKTKRKPNANSTETKPKPRANREVCSDCGGDLIYEGRAKNPKSEKDIFLLFQCARCEKHFRLDK